MTKRKRSKKTTAAKTKNKRQKSTDSRPAFFKRHDLPWGADASEGIWDLAMSFGGAPVIENGEFFPGVHGSFKPDRFYIDAAGDACAVFNAKLNALAIQCGLVTAPTKKIKELWPHATIRTMDYTSKGTRYIISAPVRLEWGDPTTLNEYDFHIVWNAEKKEYSTALTHTGGGAATLRTFATLPEEGVTADYLRMVAGERLALVDITLRSEDEHLVEEVGLVHVASSGTLSSHRKIYVLPPS